MKNFKEGKKKIKRKSYIFILAGIILLSLSLAIILENRSARELEIYTEISFVTPKDAIVFWKSKDSTLGYVKYSEKRFGKKTTVLQTSSEPGEIHVVFIENIPKEGVYFKKVKQGDGIFIFPKVELLKYDGSLDE